jgi:hypothetical protein
MGTPIDWQRWSLYKGAIEACLREDFAPINVAGGKGSAVNEAERRLRANGGITCSTNTKSVLLQWVKAQEGLAQRGKANCLPDWSLYIPPDRKHAAARGELGYAPVLPGYEIKNVSSKTDDGHWVKQERAHGSVFEMPEGQRLKGVSALTDGEDRIIVKWTKTDIDRQERESQMRAVVEALKSEIVPVSPVEAPKHGNADLLNQFTLTDLHFGMMSWREETGEDYDLKIAEKLLMDWFSVAVTLAPQADTAILANIGDLIHHDSHDSVTPVHHHVLDSDSRLQKVIRVIIRTVRRIVRMLLEKHKHVHIIMADANHDPASEAWLRELFAAFYDNEPRVTVDSSASTYYAYEHGETSLFYHHGHRRRINTVDSVFAGKFRELYGRTKFSYAHTGHLHSDELKSTNLMKIERHETLAAADAYAANGGWLSGRSAKVITYSKRFGKVTDLIISAEMAADPDACRIYG